MLGLRFVILTHNSVFNTLRIASILDLSSISLNQTHWIHHNWGLLSCLWVALQLWLLQTCYTFIFTSSNSFSRNWRQISLCNHTIDLSSWSPCTTNLERFMRVVKLIWTRRHHGKVLLLLLLLLLIVTDTFLMGHSLLLHISHLLLLIHILLVVSDSPCKWNLIWLSWLSVSLLATSYYWNYLLLLLLKLLLLSTGNLKVLELWIIFIIDLKIDAVIKFRKWSAQSLVFT